MRHLALASLALSLTSACGGSDPRAVTLRTASETLFECGAATLEDLSPTDGGYKFVCKGGDGTRQLYLVRDTSERKDGSIKDLTLLSPGQPARSLKVAIAANDGGVPCEWAAALGRKTGEDPIPKGQLGTFTLAMADPCGPVTLTVSEPRP